MAVIYLNPEAFDTSKTALMGRHAAGEGFLQGYLRHAKAERLHFWNVAGEKPEALSAFLERFDLAGRPVNWINNDNISRLGEGGIVQIPSPKISEHVWMRAPYGRARYGVCGVTHTTATTRITEFLVNTLLGPVQPWDAIICTSRAVRASVTTLLEAASDHLRSHLGATTITAPRFETIPLGVNTDTFRADAQHRHAWREKLGIPEDGVVALYVGRFNLTAKMNPVPMAMALERAAKRTGKPVHWVLSGWADDKSAKRFHDFTRAHCPSVGYHVVDGRKPENRFSIWSVGDLFLSLSDNVQETFGLTPVEAMAAGLPCVISDWNGYKDTVRHEVDGFRISSYTPRAGRGQDMAFRHGANWDSYDTYVAQVSQFTAIDLDEATDALSSLIENPDLRRRMGEAGRQRAVETFDWAAVIPLYEALWGELDALRLKAAPSAPAQRNTAENPWALDPYRLFASYPTEWLTVHSMVGLGVDMTEESALKLLSAPMVSAGTPVLPRPQEAREIIAFLAAQRQCRVAEVTARFPASRRPFVERGLVWLAKYGVLKIYGRSTHIPD